MLKVDNLLKRFSVGFPNMPKSYKTLLKSNINPEMNKMESVKMERNYGTKVLELIWIRCYYKIICKFIKRL